MPQWLQWSLIAGGLVVIVCLLWIIIRQAKGIRDTRRRAEKAEAFQKERRDGMIESIRIIAMAVETDQVEYSEACLRIKGLLDHVAPELLEQSPYRVFLEVYEKLQHMPTHQARQETETRFVAKMDKERFEVEKMHADAIRRAATAIRHHQFSD
jgi:flagellar biosynthesis/type III secretory pathway M-ring protein FliF/YscJ